MPPQPGHTCPCGCGRPLPMISGKRRLVCDAFWRDLPVAVKSDFTSPASDPIRRRIALRTILKQAEQMKASRVANNGEQLSLL